MHKIQYEYGLQSNGKNNYAILDPSKKYSVISLSRLIKDGIHINSLSLKSIFIPEEMKVVELNLLISKEEIQKKIEMKVVELNLLVGKEKIQKKISVILSEEPRERFYLGNDFLSSFYSIEKIGNTTKYYLRQEIETKRNNMNENFYISVKGEEYEKIPKQSLNTFIIPLIIAVFAIIILNYQSITDLSLSSIIDKNGFQSSTKLLIGNMPLARHSSEFNFSEFVINAEELGYEIVSFKLTSKEIINQNVLNCYILANRFDRIIPQLMVNLHDFIKKLKITKNSYVKIYSDGAWLFREFEECIDTILNYISNELLKVAIHPKIDNDEEKLLSHSIEYLFDALRTFYSSVKEAYEATLTAELLRNGTHGQVIEARSVLNNNSLSPWHKISNDINSIFDKTGENSANTVVHEAALSTKSLRIGIHEQVIRARSVLDNNNLSPWNKISNYIYSIFDKAGENSLIIDDEIANTEVFLKNISHDLKGITKALLNFKENLEKYSNVFRKLLANTESLKRLKLNEQEIEKTTKLLDMIKENHKNYKSKSSIIHL